MGLDQVESARREERCLRSQGDEGSRCAARRTAAHFRKLWASAHSWLATPTLPAPSPWILATGAPASPRLLAAGRVVEVKQVVLFTPFPGEFLSEHWARAGGAGARGWSAGLGPAP